MSLRLRVDVTVPFAKDARTWRSGLFFSEVDVRTSHNHEPRTLHGCNKLGNRVSKKHGWQLVYKPPASN